MHTQPNERRVVVVGGGVVGCATAFDLARAGYDVTLVERDAIAAHASGKSAGNLNPLIGTLPAHLRSARDAFALHREIYLALKAAGCADYGLAQVKRVHLGFEGADRQELEELAVTCNAGNGFSAVWLDRSDLQRIEPRLAQDFAFGVLTEGSFSVSSGDFSRALARGAARHCAKIVIGSVTGIVTRHERAVIVKTTSGPIACDELVLATGPWVAETRNWLGIDVAVAPVKGQMLRLRLEGGVPDCDFTWQSTSLYKRQGQELWAGGTMEHCGFDTTATLEARTALLDRAARIMPAVKQAEVLEHTAALRPMSVSGGVIADAAPGWRNVYLANGGGAKGVLLSVAIARKLRSLLQAGPDERAAIPPPDAWSRDAAPLSRL